MKHLILSAIISLIAMPFLSQENYTIRATINTEGLPPEYAAYGEQEMVTYIKGERTKTEVTSMMFSTSVYFDGKILTSLTDAMGNKTGFSATKEELDAAEKDKKNDNKPKIEYTSEKKTIAGYECTKAVITSIDKDKKENKAIVWATEKISVGAAGRKGSGRGGMIDLGDLNGHPLAMEVHQNYQGTEMKIMMTTTEVLKTPLKDAVFIPNTEGYKMLSYKEMIEKQKAMEGK